MSELKYLGSMRWAIGSNVVLGDSRDFGVSRAPEGGLWRCAGPVRSGRLSLPGAGGAAGWGGTAGALRPLGRLSAPRRWRRPDPRPDPARPRGAAGAATGLETLPALHSIN